MRALVCGSRYARDEDAVWNALDAIHAQTPISFIIEGGQRTYEDGKLVGGVDLFACRWSYHVGIPGRRFDAEWTKLGRAAGPIRNQQMLDEGRPDLVVAFPGGSGTADMVRRAKAAGVPIATPSQAIEE